MLLVSRQAGLVTGDDRYWPEGFADELLDELACKDLPVLNPATGTDCFTTGSEPEHLRDVNRYAVALLDGRVQAGALDEYAKCQYLPVVKSAPAG